MENDQLKWGDFIFNAHGWQWTIFQPAVASL